MPRLTPPVIPVLMTPWLPVLGQAAFGIYDGHGGSRAVDYASQHLATNIVESMAAASECGVALEDAVKEGYLLTDREFLKQVTLRGRGFSCRFMPIECSLPWLLTVQLCVNISSLLR